jgi:anaerobic selenocysteine-containing dehydrogenase
MERRDFLKRSALAGAGVALATGFTFPTHHSDAPKRKRRNHDRPGGGDGDNGGGGQNTSCVWGAYVNPEGKPTKTAIEQFEAQIGRKLGMTRHYTHWDMPLPGRTIEWSAQGGRLPLVAWASDKLNGQYIKWADIARGEQDAWITRQAETLKAAGYPMVFCFHHEPEDEPWAGNAREFAGAYERIISIFDAAGVTNLKYAVTLMVSTFDGGHGGADAWMPPKYDYVGADGYNRVPQMGPSWRSFKQLFQSSHQYAVKHGKGLFVEETGSVECKSSNAKADWFKEMGQTVLNWPEVVGVEYSHTLANYRGTPMPYWVDSSNSALDAYREVGADPCFKP